EIRITDDLLGRFVEKPPPGFIPMIEATKQLGVSRQTVLQRVKRGELQAVHIRQGRRKGLRIKVLDSPAVTGAKMWAREHFSLAPARLGAILCGCAAATQPCRSKSSRA